MIQIQNAIPRIDRIAFKNAINWKINKGEHWAIIGPNGAGKTILTDIIIGKYVLRTGQLICKDDDGNDLKISETIKCVAFRDIYSLSDIKNSYYQQRWNAGDVHDAPTVSSLFAGVDEKWTDFLIKTFAIEDLLNKQINLLSSGELRKTLIVRSLLRKPRILILDNPFIGLDMRSRSILNDLFKKLAELEDIQIVLVLSNVMDIPKIITHILPIKDKTLLKPITASDFIKDKDIHDKLFNNTTIGNLTFNKVLTENNESFKKALEFRNVYVKYGKRTILKDLNWEIKKGEKWALLGENGAGKSTLLSLVSADNPQAYANNIVLFDRKRGTGESIWDIKKRIGYISPEMHLYYQKNVRCLDIVGSGFFDSIGLYRKCTVEQEAEALRWMNIFQVGHLKDGSFLDVSSGEQRLILLARVFVKKPDLLILDEPLHGLDSYNKKLVRNVIENYCTPDKSLIYVTHYENEIPSVIDKRLVLSKNKVD